MADIRSQIITLRNKLDRVAELAWQEKKTAKLLIELLGQPYWHAKTALIYKIGTGPVSIFFRAELDALNTTNGTRHVCGHSSHMSALAFAYKTLSKNPPVDKTIYFVFQPSEEGYPSGAQFISSAFPPIGKCRAGFGFHVAPSIQLGTVMDIPMAAADYFEINVSAQATHIKNKHTHTGGDAIKIAAEITCALNGMQSPEYIVNVGTIKGGETPNSIAGKTLLTGDIRALSYKQLQSGRSYLKLVISKYPEANLSLFTGFPVLINEKKLVALVGQRIRVTRASPTYGTEDFSLYPVPYAFFHIGTGKQTQLHSFEFKVPDELVFILYKRWLILSGMLF